MTQKLFFIEYDNSCDGCPVHTGGKFYQDDIWTGEHEWNFEDPNPDKYEIKSKYSLKMNESFINFDYSGHTYVSEDFLKILDECDIKYRAIPQEILLRGGTTPKKSYFVLLLVGRTFLLDKEVSTYNIAKNPNNREELLYEKYFPNEYVYDLVESFHIKKDESFPDFFICAEFKKTVCTEKFKKLCENKDILGAKFIELIDGFRYDPWDF